MIGMFLTTSPLPWAKALGRRILGDEILRTTARVAERLGPGDLNFGVLTVMDLPEPGAWAHDGKTVVS